MALSKVKKDEVVQQVSNLLATSKMTVVTKYQGTPVKALQQLRRNAKENGTQLKVVKNRLVIKAIQATDSIKDVDTKELNGMLLYAFNSQDEVAPAQVIAQFAKQQPTLEFVGAITEDGKFMTSEEVKALSQLPGKAQLIAGVINTLQSPIRNAMSGLGGNLHGLLDAIAAKAA